jgi:hypothetical protein
MAEEMSDFDIMRQRIRERELRRGKEASQAVKGQFASRGQLQSGAQIKAQERAQQAVANQAREERRDVLLAEADVRRREREAAAQRQFARGERLGQQQFAGQQAELQRQFAGRQAQAQRQFLTGERMSAQDFARAEALLGRQFTAEERRAAESFQEKFAQGREDFTAEERQAAQTFASAEAEAQRQFAAEESQLGRVQAQDFFQKTLDEQIAAREQNATQFDQEMDLNRKNSYINTINALKGSGFTNFEVGNILVELGVEDPFADPGSPNTQNSSGGTGFSGLNTPLQTIGTNSGGGGFGVPEIF